MIIWERYCSIVRAINRYGAYIGALFLMLLSGLVAVEVIGRNLFAFSTMIADEYSGYLCGAAIMFGGAYALAQDVFIHVDIVYRFFRGKFKRIVDALCALTALAYCGVLLKYCGSAVIYAYQNGTTSNTIAFTPLYIPQMALAIGIIMLAAQIIVNFGNTLIRKEEGVD